MISNNLTLLSESFPSENGGQPATRLGNRNRCAVPGTLFNTNTLEGFYGLDKQSLLKAEAKKVWDDICCGAVEKDCSLLSRYLLISFADLKNWRFHYWFASPALVLDPPARLPTLTPASKWFSVEQVLILLYVRYPCKVLDPKHAEKVTHSDPLLSLGNL